MVKFLFFGDCICYMTTVSMEKQKIAEEVASILKLTVDIDTISSKYVFFFSFSYIDSYF